MKITRIQTSNFLGARAVDVALSRPVALFAGKNGAGKTSLYEAIRMALTGETVRVGLKKEYDRLLSEGAESGFVSIDWNGGEASVVMPKGERHIAAGEQISGALPYILDAQRFSSMTENDRRSFLFGLMGIKLDGPAIKANLLARGCDPKKVDMTSPLLRAGFEAAADEAKSKARDAKASWRTTTGETYGEKKAEDWKAESPAFSPDTEKSAKDEVEALDVRIEEASATLGARRQAATAASTRSTRLEELREKAGRYARIQDKLFKDEAELKEWQEKVAALKDSAKSQDAIPCPDCGVMLVLKDGALVHAGPMTKGTDDDLGKLPEYEKAMQLLQRSVENDKRDLAAANAAAEALKEFDNETAEAPSEADIQAAADALETLKSKRKEAQVKLDAERAAMRQASEADGKTKKAAEYHADVLAWVKIADALAPDGIPAELLAAALEPFNERLLSSSILAEWEQVVIHSDMRITYGLRDYAMISESEKWRADAMIAEAVSFISGIKLLVLDRFDLLDLKGREDLLYWLDGMATAGDIDSALIFGTLKALPAVTLSNIEAHWIDNGATGQIREAA